MAQHHQEQEQLQQEEPPLNDPWFDAEAHAEEEEHLGVGAARANPNVKLPAFWEEDPQLWFLQAEAIFAAHRINTQRRRAQYVISHLPFRVLTQIADLARAPGVNAYNDIKERLTSTYGQSQERKIIRLLEETQLGDQKPSQLLRQMQTLVGTTAPNEVIKTVWLRALPSRIRAILSSLEQDDLSKLATVADKILEVDSGTVQTSSVQAALEKSLTQRIIEEVADLKKLVLQDRGRSPTRHDQDNYRHRSSSHGRSASRQRKKGGLCYYHFRFREDATKCRPPCNWKQQPDTAGKKPGN